MLGFGLKLGRLSITPPTVGFTLPESPDSSRLSSSFRGLLAVASALSPSPSAASRTSRVKAVFVEPAPTHSSLFTSSTAATSAGSFREVDRSSAGAAVASSACTPGSTTVSSGIDDGKAAGKTAKKSLPPVTPEGTENVDAVKNDGNVAAATSPAEKPDAMEVSDAAASSVITKRQRDIADGVAQNNENVAFDEPPAKASTGRRATLRPKPNIPPDRRPAATPWASQTP
ncbi:hypothetical protein HPB48_015590 [Haemaphysalis longicornis]|uniref:Uncharacterized protein n=1 Tax=Haemaphysalis longicornis TaxID=44386 RepID=A0A9J6FJB6_HAELO|nr:hypothetical protein HPB48_015590 [Haemaphysalis longicornis]